VLYRRLARHAGTQWLQISKTRPKLDSKIREIDGSCIDLTSFEYEVRALTGNGSYLNMQKLA
jgi:hypothetical protein